MRKFFTLLILLMFTIPAHATVVDPRADNGGVVSRVATEEYSEQVPPALSQRTFVKTEEESEADYWNKQLDEATSNYEKAREELLKEGEKLVWHRYGSKTQYQMFTAEIPGITQRLETYRQQMIEAKAMLDKFATGSQETGDGRGEREVSSVKNGETDTDRYGRDERWWKEKVRPWREELEEATRNYDETRDAFVKRVEGLGPSAWGRMSLTQYQMISSRLTELNDEMTMYESQIAEANGMLARLSKEAREAGADPAWLE